MSIFIGETINNWLKIKRHLFPATCLLCGARSEKGSLCRGCLADLPYLPASRCPVCALPALSGNVCGACLSEPPEYHSTVAALSYSFPLDALIHALKYRANLALAVPLADLLAQAASPRLRPDYLVPMPLYPARLRERGFNQALEIAKRVSKLTGIALLPNACRRIRDTPPQASMPWKERARNIRGAFACDANLSGRRIAVIDDVMTTGATMNELAKVLRKQKAAEVECWAVARTLREG